jgi:hypothetical protein
MVDPQLSQELSLLRILAANLERTVIPVDPRVAEMWRANGMEPPPGPPPTRTTIKPPGREALSKLAECIVGRIPSMARGAMFKGVQAELFGQLETYVGRDPQSIKAADAQKLLEHFGSWFQAQVQPRCLYVPCVISPWPAPPFIIGPVSFVFIDDIPGSDFYPSQPNGDRLKREAFDELMQLMRHTHANWLARIDVDGCDPERSQEIAELAVDLALFALQLSAPVSDTRGMCRLDARRGFVEKRTLSETAGRASWGIQRTEPGMSIGPGTLAEILRQAQPVIASVGRIVASFASGMWHQPTLERAWCDAAYWMRESLFDNVDSVAVTKLETALEVLICTESSKNSTARVTAALQNLLGVKRDEQILPPFDITTASLVTALVRDRSRIMHGTWSTLGTRPPSRRDGIEAVVGAVLRQAAIHLHAYASEPAPVDTIEAFFAWLEQKRTPAAA